MKNGEFDSFLYFAEQPNSGIGLAIGALHIAQSEYPDVNIDDYLHQTSRAFELTRTLTQTSTKGAMR